MMKPVFIMFLIGIMFPFKIFPQTSDENKTKKTGLLVGISHNQLSESLLNNLIHKGGGLNIGFDREIRKDNSIRQIELIFGSDFLKSRYEKEIASYHFNSSFIYSYLFEILHSSQSSRTIYLGGIASADMNLEYFDNWDENHYYWLTSYSLGGNLRLENPVFNTNRFQLEVDIPFISLVSRPPV